MINILMIEDDPEFSLFLGEYLEKYNIKITNYKDPYLGLSMGIDNYDLLSLDLTLLGMDGLEVCVVFSQGTVQQVYDAILTLDPNKVLVKSNQNNSK